MAACCPTSTEYFIAWPLRVQLPSPVGPLQITSMSSRHFMTIFWGGASVFSLLHSGHFLMLPWFTQCWQIIADWQAVHCIGLYTKHKQIAQLKLSAPVWFPFTSQKAMSSCTDEPLLFKEAFTFPMAAWRSLFMLKFRGGSKQLKTLPVLSFTVYCTACESEPPSALFKSLKGSIFVLIKCRMNINFVFY